ncbi:MAG TPA: TadE/TadG family type IV pilus assembly protein [Rhizomicrobium sp.]|jgi:Flp pilus assembly protein TadG|nr:TadE/TadG family type IV pilus assembly protein [Rhizomicrobium sp.]
MMGAFLTFLKKYRDAKSGLAAVEFALIAPVLIALFLGSVTLSNALIVREKVASVASSAADLVAQSTQISDSGMSDIFSALNALVFPYSTDGAKIVIASIISDGKGGAKVAWSDAQNTAPYSVGQTITVPDGLITSTGSVILAKIDYDYNSPVAGVVGNLLTMSDQFYARPRKTAQVKRVP